LTAQGETWGTFDGRRLHETYTNPNHPLRQEVAAILMPFDSDPDFFHDMGDRYPIGQLQNNPTPSGTRRTDGRRPLPRQWRLAFVRREANREGG